MRGMLIRRAVRKSVKAIRYVDAVPPSVARGRVADVYRRIEHDFGVLAPPMALHSPSPEVLSAAWIMLRETLLANGQVDRGTKEAVAAAVSLSNACPYCVDVHGATMGGLGHRGDAAAIAADRLDGIGDDSMRRIAGWARASATGAAPPKVPAAHLAELAGVAITFHYLNRMVSVFLGNDGLLAGLPEPARQTLLRTVGGRIGAGAARPRLAGESLDLLPPADLPAELSWAAAGPVVGPALGRVAAAIDEAGRRAVPDEVRALVEDALSTWDGQPTGIGRGWVETAVAELPAAHRPAGRLALLVALAAYQVDDQVVADYRGAGADDRALIEFASWTAMAAARRVASQIRLGSDVAD